MLQKCEVCGKFFGPESPNQTKCSACSVTGQRLARHVADAQDPKFVIARDIVYDFPEISPEELKNRMADMNIEITIREIMGYVREGRLSIVKGPATNICEECGKGILGGRLCPRCAANLEQAITKNNESQKPKVEEKNDRSGPTMHTKHK